MTNSSLLNYPKHPEEEKQIALSLISALMEAPNQELRGRTPTAGWERINKFMAEDSYLASLKVAVAETMLGADKFQEEVIHELSIFERRANRNPQVIKKFEKQVDHETIYREIADLIFDAFSSNPLKFSDIAKTQESTKSPQKETVNSPTPVQLKNTEEALTKTKSSSEVESEVKLERLLSLTDKFRNHQLTQIRDQYELAELIFEISLNPETQEFSDLAKQHIGKDGEHHLIEISGISRACVGISQNKNTTFKELSDVFERIRNTEGYGLSFDGRPLKHFVDAGILTPESKETILNNHNLIKSADPVALRLATRMLDNYPITFENLKDLDSIVTSLKANKKPDLWIENRLNEALKTGPQKITHLKNVASIAKWDINIEPLLSKTAEGEEIIRMAAHGELDVVSQNDSHYKKLLQAGIDSSLRVIRDSKPEHKTAITNATKTLRQDARFDLFDIQDTLAKFAKNSKCSNLEDRLIELGKAMSKLSMAGCSLDKLQKIAELAPTQYNDKGDEKTIQFLANLATLSDDGVRGIENLIDSSLPVLSRRAQGDETQHFAGFPVEASTAIHLKEAGYEICSLSSSLKSNYQYDIIAKNHDGQTFGIEVKRTLDTLISKNYKSSLNQTDDIVGTQIYKHALSAQIDGIIPVIAILYRHEDSWARTPARHLLDSVEKHLGIKTLLMNRMDCRFVKI
jgi:hypothetical protein